MISREKSCHLSAIVICLASLCLSVYAQSQTSSAPNPEPRMVILNVRVTDTMSHAVIDVNQDAFSVAEDGVVQKIALFSKEVIPLSYGLVIDNSGSLRSQLSEVVRTGARIVNSNQPADETFIVRFISSDKIETVQNFTSDKRLLNDGLASLYVEGGQTALIDAIYISAERLGQLKTEKLRRRALIVITDGEDRASYYKEAQLFELLAKSDIQIYVVGFTNELKGKTKPRAVELLNRLVTDTGGRVFFPQSLGELAHVADEIVNDIRTQYVIGYVPSGNAADNSFHKVQVSIANNQGQEKCVAITRVGYSASGRN
ncbi:MAG: VWA domain-containing protein [Pyrinomonadaceae bacterium]